MDLLEKTLRASGNSVTAARRAVFEALKGREAISMHELVLLSKIDRASVYRVIELFERLGIVQRLQIGWKYKIELSSAYSHHHHHMTCTRCGSVITFEENPELESRLHALAKEHNFVLREHQIELRGLCFSCARDA